MTWSIVGEEDLETEFLNSPSFDLCGEECCCFNQLREDLTSWSQRFGGNRLWFLILGDKRLVLLLFHRTNLNTLALWSLRWIAIHSGRDNMPSKTLAYGIILGTNRGIRMTSHIDF